VKKTITLKIVCQSCGGTGVYVGMAEKSGFAVRCHTCKGSGCQDYNFTYAPFVKRVARKNVKQVVESNPGIFLGVGKDKHLTLQSFGGMSYADFFAGKTFKQGMEMRTYVCPAWWYQCANYDLKPKWDECECGAFSNCKQFATKERCWAKFDKEHPINKQEKNNG